MQDKLSALDDAMDFIKLAINEIKEYSELSDFKCDLDEIKMDLMEKYREVEEEIQEQKERDYDLKLAYAEGKL